MRNYGLGGVAIASVFAATISIAPASAQGNCGNGQTCSSHRRVGAGPVQHHHPGYARGYGRGYGVGVGVAAGLAAGAIVGGAIQQDQGYELPRRVRPRRFLSGLFGSSPIG